MATDASTQPRKPRLRKRYLIPAGLLVLLGLFFAWLYWRGTVADTVERNPRSATDGVVTQLLTQDGRTFPRTAVIVDAPPADVWKVVSDYDRQAEFLPYLSQISSTKLDEGRVRISGVAHSRIWGDWPFESVITQIERPEREQYGITWDEKEDGTLAVNRGSWSLEPVGSGQTLVVYTLQVEVRGSPQFLVRNVLLSRIGSLLLAVRDEVGRRAGG